MKYVGEEYCRQTKEGNFTSDKENYGYFCFADFEFTCGSFIDNTKSEMLSVGAVICSEDFGIVDKYYSTARPQKFPRMTKQCRELTGLTQAEITASPDSNEALRRLVSLMKLYDISKLFVWGNFDKPGLEGDINQHRRKKAPYGNVSFICRNIIDIQDEVTKKMKLPQAVSISELSAVFDYAPESGKFHNALNDAEALYTICKAVYTTDIDTNEKFVRLRNERLEKIAAAKAATVEKLREEALSIPLSTEEAECFEPLKAEGKEKQELAFIHLRAKFVRALKRSPEAEDFVFAEYSSPKRVKVLPASKFKNAARCAASKCYPFKREDFRKVFLNEYKKP